jgi:hypothetical protein
MVATVAPLHVLMLHVLMFVVTAVVAVVAVAATISTLVASNMRRVLPRHGLQV